MYNYPGIVKKLAKIHVERLKQKHRYRDDNGFNMQHLAATII
jgi:hypothetical protein